MEEPIGGRKIIYIIRYEKSLNPCFSGRTNRRYDESDGRIYNRDVLIRVVVEEPIGVSVEDWTGEEIVYVLILVLVEEPIGVI